MDMFSSDVAQDGIQPIWMSYLLGDAGYKSKSSNVDSESGCSGDGFTRTPSMWDELLKSAKLDERWKHLSSPLEDTKGIDEGLRSRPMKSSITSATKRT